MTTSTIDLYCFFRLDGDTPGNYFIFYLILIDTVLNKKTYFLKLAVIIETLGQNTLIGLKVCKIPTVNLSKFNTH